VKIEEVNSKTDTELAFELDKMKKELFELRFKSRTAGNSSPARIRVLKRAIARVHTVRHERAKETRKGTTPKGTTRKGTTRKETTRKETRT
jgi:large subunit ribosomal protein L29